MTAATSYALDNHHSGAAVHHRALADLLDGQTRQRIVGLPSWPRVRRCLDVGAGGGSIACWLAGQLGDAEVVALDVKPNHIPAMPRLVSVAHDLTSGRPLVDVVGAGFDLIVTRMTLQHLRQARAVLTELGELLAPGGVLLVEDWAALRAADDVVRRAPNGEAAALYRRFQTAIAATFEAAGADRGWARRVYGYMCDDGLVDVQTIYGSSYWSGGSPGMRLIASSATQLEAGLAEHGLSQADLDALPELLQDPRLVIEGHPLYSTTGVQPA